jgi:hypothetical protein
MKPSSCTAWAMLQTFGMLSSLTAANGERFVIWSGNLLTRYTALLGFRLVALYRRKRHIVWFIHTFFAVSYITCLALIIQAMITFHGESSVSTPACFMSDSHQITSTTRQYSTSARLLHHQKHSLPSSTPLRRSKSSSSRLPPSEAGKIRSSLLGPGVRHFCSFCIEVSI